MARKQLATVVFTDAVGYSAMASQQEEVAVRAMQADMTLLSKVFEANNGRVVKNTGDGLLAVFDSAASAVQSCLDAQKQLSEATTPVFQHRMGIHLGDVYFSEGDVFGDGVNVAARLQNEAPSGGIAFSRTVYDVVAGKVDIPAICIGPRQLKNINKPVEVWHVNPLFAGADINAAHSSGDRNPRTRALRWWQAIPVLAGLVVIALIARGQTGSSKSALPSDKPNHSSLSNVAVIPVDETPSGEPLVIAYQGLSTSQIEQLSVRVDGQTLLGRRGRGSSYYEYDLRPTGKVFAMLNVSLDGRDLLTDCKIAIVPKGALAVTNANPSKAVGDGATSEPPPISLDNVKPVSRTASPSLLVGKYVKPWNDLYPDPQSLKAKLIELFEQFEGTPYKWGGNSLKSGIDCSHFVEQMIKLAGGPNIPAPVTMQEQYGTIVHRGARTVSRRGGTELDLSSAPEDMDALWPGDRVIFQFPGRGDSSGSRHEGIYLGEYRNLKHAFIACKATTGVALFDLDGKAKAFYAYATTDYYLGKGDQR